MATLRSMGTSTRLLAQRQALLSPPLRTIFIKAAVPQRSRILTGFYGTVFILSTGLFAAYYFDARSALHRYVLTPMLRYTLDAETGHKVAVKVLRSGLGPRDLVSDDEKLKFEVRYSRVSQFS